MCFRAYNRNLCTSRPRSSSSVSAIKKLREHLSMPEWTEQGPSNNTRIFISLCGRLRVMSGNFCAVDLGGSENGGNSVHHSCHGLHTSEHQFSSHVVAANGNISCHSLAVLRISAIWGSRME
eukprot:2914682-Rhodomonas_salina.2